VVDEGGQAKAGKQGDAHDEKSKEQYHACAPLGSEETLVRPNGPRISCGDY
jgi:hypothetical protein